MTTILPMQKSQEITSSKETINPLYPKELIEACGGSEAFCKIPVLELIGARALNKRGGIKNEEVTHLLMRGEVINTDTGKLSPFLTFRYFTSKTEPKTAFLSDEAEYVVYLYPTERGWMTGCSDDNASDDDIGILLEFSWRGDSALDYIKRLVDGKPCGCSDVHGNEIDLTSKKSQLQLEINRLNENEHKNENKILRLQNELCQIRIDEMAQEIFQLKQGMKERNNMIYQLHEEARSSSCELNKLKLDVFRLEDVRQQWEDEKQKKLITIVKMTEEGFSVRSRRRIDSVEDSVKSDTTTSDEKPSDQRGPSWLRRGPSKKQEKE